MAVSQMDVPARQAFVMAQVVWFLREERAAAATVTTVPRSLAPDLPPCWREPPWKKTNSDGRW